MKIALSTFYGHLARPVSQTVLDEAYLVNEVIDLHRASWVGLRGPQDVARAAPRRSPGRPGPGRPADGHRRCPRRGPWPRYTVTTRRDQAAVRHPDLVKRGWNTPALPDQLWVADFSYVGTLAGFCYVSLVTDVYSRRILGWRVSASKHTALVTAALQQAMYTRRRGDTCFTTTG